MRSTTPCLGDPPPGARSAQNGSPSVAAGCSSGRNSRPRGGGSPGRSPPPGPGEKGSHMHIRDPDVAISSLPSSGSRGEVAASCSYRDGFKIGLGGCQAIGIAVRLQYLQTFPKSPGGDWQQPRERPAVPTSSIPREPHLLDFVKSQSSVLADGREKATDVQLLHQLNILDLAWSTKVKIRIAILWAFIPCSPLLAELGTAEPRVITGGIEVVSIGLLLCADLFPGSPLSQTTAKRFSGQRFREVEGKLLNSPPAPAIGCPGVRCGRNSSLHKRYILPLPRPTTMVNRCLGAQSIPARLLLRLLVKKKLRSANFETGRRGSSQTPSALNRCPGRSSSFSGWGLGVASGTSSQSPTKKTCTLASPRPQHEKVDEGTVRFSQIETHPHNCTEGDNRFMRLADSRFPGLLTASFLEWSRS